MIILILAIFVLFFMKLVRNKFEIDEKGMFSLVLAKMQWPFFTRFMDFAAFPVFFYSLLEISYNELRTTDDYANFFIAMGFLGFYAGFLIILFMIVNFKSKSNYFLSNYDVLIEKMRVSDFCSRNYLSFRILVKLAIVGSLLVFMEKFRLQIVGIMFVLLIKLLFIITVKPFINNVNNLLESFHTFFLFILYSLLLYASYDLIHLKIISLAMLLMVFFNFLFNSMPFFLILLQNTSKIKENLSNFTFALGIALKRKHFFIDFEEKPSQCTKENVSREQKQYDDFFKNPSPEISEHSHEIAKINLGNYVQTEIKENEHFENRDKKKKLINIVSKSYTTRDHTGNGKIVKIKADLSYSQRIEEELAKEEMCGSQVKVAKKKGKSMGTFKELFSKK